MFAFIRRHWLAYVIGIVVAIIVGFGASYIFGIKGSTPESVRAEHVAAEKSAKKSSDAMAAAQHGSVEE